MEEVRGQNTKKDISACQVTFRQSTTGRRLGSGLGLSEGRSLVSGSMVAAS